MNSNLGNSMYSTKWHNQSCTWENMHIQFYLVSVSQWPRDKMKLK